MVSKAEEQDLEKESMQLVFSFVSLCVHVCVCVCMHLCACVRACMCSMGKGVWRLLVASSSISIDATVSDQ